MERALKLNEKKAARKRMNCILLKAPIWGWKWKEKGVIRSGQPEDLILKNAMDRKHKGKKKTDKTRG